VDKSLAQKKEEKRGERARDVIANPFCYSPGWASHFTGPPFVCTPHPAEKGRTTPLRRRDGLAAAVPGRREREREAEAVVVVEEKRV